MGGTPKRKATNLSLQELILGSTFFCLWIVYCCQVTWQMGSGLSIVGFGFPFPMGSVYEMETVEYRWSIVGLAIDCSFGLLITILVVKFWGWVSLKVTLRFRAISNQASSDPAVTYSDKDGSDR